jgi:hypothetical protein
LGQIVDRDRMFLLDRIVLVGSVLPVHFAWETIFARDENRINAVRNEVGKRDGVLRFVRRINFLVKYLGLSGLTGFAGSENLIHNVQNPWGPCRSCNDNIGAAKIHNVELREFTHSEVFLREQHVRNLWLPFLWGLSPQEFLDWLILCTYSAYYEQQRRWSDWMHAQKKLRERNWSWVKECGSKSRCNLDQQLTRSIKVYMSTLGVSSRDIGLYTTSPRVLRRAVRKVYLTVNEAWIESQESGLRDEHVLLGLHPATAIGRAATSVVHIRPR